MLLSFNSQIILYFYPMFDDDDGNDYRRIEPAQKAKIFTIVALILALLFAAYLLKKGL